MEALCSWKSNKFDNILFAIGENRDLHCQFDIHYCGQKASLTATKPVTQPVTQLSEKTPSEYSDQGERSNLFKQNQPHTEEDTSRRCTIRSVRRLVVMLD